MVMGRGLPAAAFFSFQAFLLKRKEKKQSYNEQKTIRGKGKEGFTIEKCSFCGRGIDEVDGLARSPVDEEIYICNRCARNAGVLIRNEIIRNEVCREREEKKRKEKGGGAEELELPAISPCEIRRELDRFVIGQEKAKKVLSVAAYNHMKRLRTDAGTIWKSNILLAGPSGSGKTLLASALAKAMNVPFAIIDATTLTPAGYIGNNVESCLQRLLAKADGDVKLAQKGIIFIDEIDKLAGSVQTQSRSGECPGIGVQAALLKMIEGGEVFVPVTGRRRQQEGGIMLDTSNILFICGGAFSGLSNKRTENAPIGFCSCSDGKTSRSRQKITPEALVKYGMMQELVGRLPVIVTLDALDTEDLVRILTEPEDAITKEYQALFALDGVKLSFEAEALWGIAETASKNGTGARGLRSILEETLLDAMYELPDEAISECIVTAGSLAPGRPVFIRKKEYAAAGE